MLILLGFVALSLLAVGGFYGGRAVRVLLTRALDLTERKLALLEKNAKGPSIPKSIPPDLYRRITRWGTPDAQEAEHKNILDLYQTFADEPDPWLEVRNHLPREPEDRLPDEIFSGPIS